MIEDFVFLRPLWLLAIPVLILLLWLFSKRILSSRSWQSVCDPQLMPFILKGQTKKTAFMPMAVMAICSLLALFALAGPAWEKIQQPIFKSKSGLVIILDLSRSMDASDIKPSRLTRAKHQIIDILNLRKEGQTALVVYANEAFTVTPLTTDNQTIISLISSLDTGMMPSQGSSPSLAIQRANDLLQNASMQSGEILLLTDGIHPDSANETRDAIKQLKKNNYRLSIVGVGTESGAPIPLQQGGFFKDSQGAIVLPKLDITKLREFSQLSSGLYFTLHESSAALEKIYTAMSKTEVDDLTENKDELKTNSFREEGPWLLLPLLLLGGFAFRKGLMLLLIVILPFTPDAQAVDWNGLWLTPDQKAAKAFKRGDTASAAKIFKNTRWQAAALYEQENYEQALNTLKTPETSDDFYNTGNTLAKMQRFPEAINAYEKALELDADNQDAAYNLEQVKKMQQSQDSDNQSPDNKSQDDQSPDNKSQDDQSQDSKSQENRSQENQSGQNQSSENNETESQSSESEEQQPESSAEQNQSANKENNASSEADQEDQKKPETKQSKSAEDDEESNENETTQAQRQIKNDSDQKNAENRNETTEIWLRKIPDDPGGLMRRKFEAQSSRNNPRNNLNRW